MTTLIIRTFILGLLLSAAAAVAQAQDHNAKTVSAETAAKKLARQQPGTEVCYVDGANDTTLYTSFTKATQAAMRMGDQSVDVSVRCLTFDKK